MWRTKSISIGGHEALRRMSLVNIVLAIADRLNSEGAFCTAFEIVFTASSYFLKPMQQAAKSIQ